MPRFPSTSCLAWRRYLVRSWGKCSHTCCRKEGKGTEVGNAKLLLSHLMRQRLIIANLRETSSFLEVKRMVRRAQSGARRVMLWTKPLPWKRGCSPWMQQALYLLPLPMLIMQHFVVHPNRGLTLASCLLRSSTAATLAVCSAMSASVGGPHAVPNPLHSRLTKNPQRLASRSRG
jgi:hypothetical protein